MSVLLLLINTLVPTVILGSGFRVRKVKREASTASVAASNEVHTLQDDELFRLQQAPEDKKILAFYFPQFHEV